MIGWDAAFDRMVRAFLRGCILIVVIAALIGFGLGGLFAYFVSRVVG